MALSAAFADGIGSREMGDCGLDRTRSKRVHPVALWTFVLYAHVGCPHIVLARRMVGYIVARPFKDCVIEPVHLASGLQVVRSGEKIHHSQDMACVLEERLVQLGCTVRQEPD